MLTAPTLVALIFINAIKTGIAPRGVWFGQCIDLGSNLPLAAQCTKVRFGPFAPLTETDTSSLCSHPPTPQPARVRPPSALALSTPVNPAHLGPPLLPKARTKDTL